MFRIGQQIQCIKDTKYDSETPELGYMAVYEVIRIEHGRPQLEVQDYEGVRRKVFYNPNRFIRYRTEEEIIEEMRRNEQEAKEKIDYNEMKRQHQKRRDMKKR